MEIVDVSQARFFYLIYYSLLNDSHLPFFAHLLSLNIYAFLNFLSSFKIIIIFKKDINERSVPNIHSLTTRFRLRHVVLKCYLQSHNVILPQWGFKQAEVLCDKTANPNDYNNIWNVEKHRNDKCEYCQDSFFFLLCLQFCFFKVFY